MTLEEAIKYHEDAVLKLSEKQRDGYYGRLCAKKHRQLAEWLKELKQLKEKDEPKMVRYEGDGYAGGEMVYDYAYCPNCDHETEADSENWGSVFCPECGQRLRWKE